jgi:hypothetical protein
VEGSMLSGLPELPPSTAPSVPALFEGQAGLEKIPDKLPANPSELMKMKDARKTESQPTGPVGPISAAPTTRQLSDLPLIGTPVPVVQALASGPGKELGSYQIPEMPGATTSVPATAPVPAPPTALPKVSSISEPPANYDSPQWTHPERLQRSRWRESLGEPTTTTHAASPSDSSGQLGAKAN